MRLRRKIVSLGVFATVATGAALSTGGAAHADSWIVCVPYSETTGSCYQSFDDGSHSWFLYWGDHWIEF